MGVPIDEDYRKLADTGISRHEAICVALQRAIIDGRIAPGSRLPTVRSLSTQLGVSGATVAAAYKLLGQRGWTRGEVGRGTFVVGVEAPLPQRTTDSSLRPNSKPKQAPLVRRPWRRRAVLHSASRLKSRYPDALDCTSGKPDPALFPIGPYKRAFHAALDELVPDDLQYASPEPVPILADALRARLFGDGIPTYGAGMVIGSSAQQLMVLSLSIAPNLVRRDSRIVAVEEPGYQTVYDAFEYLGYRLVGMEVDREGALPDALEAAIAEGAQVALFTPRAQNPFGSSWSPTRRQELARVLEAHPGVIVIEDDQFADLARARPGSLLNEPGMANRVVYIRSFAKSIAPDLRVAVAAAGPDILNPLTEAKSFLDGWSTQLSQRALAHLLTDATLDQCLADVRAQYDRRRDAATQILTESLSHLGGVVHGEDGLNLWIELGPGGDAGEVLEGAARLGVLCSPGEPFYIRPGHNNVLRMSISGVNESEVVTAAERLAEARMKPSTGRTPSIPI